MKIAFAHPVLSATLVVLACCFTTGAAQAQTAPTVADRGPSTCSPAPCVLPPTQASEGGSEVADAPIVADPLNPTHLLLGSDDANCQYDFGFFVSSDGGVSWNRYCPSQPVGPYFPGDTPMVGYDRNGVAYIAGTYAHGGYDTGLIGIQSSTDGINWSQPVTALKEYEYPFGPWLAVDTNVGSPYLNSLYISAVTCGIDSCRIYVSHSTDSGVTWQAVAVVPAQIPPKTDQYTNMTIGKDGTVYLTWMYCDAVGNGPCGSADSADVVFSKSTDGGNTWSKPTLATTVALLPGLSILPNTNIGMPFYPVIGVDNSNGRPHSGYLYAAMYNWTGTYMRVQVIRSTDGGKTWSKPVPVAPASDTHDQFFPWLSVSSTGLVGVSWLDRRNDPANIDYQAFAAISTDGGLSFQPNVQLTQNSSNPNNNGYANNAWMGDYTGNTWDGPNYFIAAWMDSSNGIDMQDVVGGIRLK
jgi:hypothetical protein